MPHGSSHWACRPAAAPAQLNPAGSGLSLPAAAAAEGLGLALPAMAVAGDRRAAAVEPGWCYSCCGEEGGGDNGSGDKGSCCVGGGRRDTRSSSPT